MRATFALLLLTLAAPLYAQERALPFDKAWTLEGDRTAIATYDGRQVLQVESGFGHRRDVAIRDGTIDFDVQVTRRRSFVYVNFRVVADAEREEFYIRPHKSTLPDSVQYAPVFQDRSAWQLHHGPGGTAAIAIDPGEWIHIRAVFKDRQAAIFVKDMTTPAVLVPLLARDPAAGSISLGGFLPAGTPGSGPIARFSNVVIRPDVSFDLAAAVAKAKPTPAPNAKPEAQATLIREWSVSNALTVEDQTIPRLPDAKATGTFTRLETDANGMLNLDRFVKLAPGTRLSAAVARVTVRAAQAGTYVMDLGFSDTATVFLNGTPILHDNDSYSHDRPRRDGLIGFDQARIYLPLKQGDNELSIVVTDTFGGWGIMGRMVAAPGLTVSAAGR